MSDSLLLDVQGVSKYFGGLQANEDISFLVKKGEIVSIIGPNGAGKSTLFSCVTGFHRVDKGRVLFKAGRRWWRDFPGCVFVRLRKRALGAEVRS